MKRATTSASNLFRRALCPGSARLESAIPEEEQESEWSAEGTLLHACFMAPNAPQRASLTPEQLETVVYAERLTEEFFGNVRAQFGILETASYVDEKEIELWLCDDGANPILPGHCDLRRYWPAHAVTAIVDAKFGYRPVETALDNIQLASYAAMSWQDNVPHLAAGYAAVAIIQPRAFGPRLTQAVYPGADLDDVAETLLGIHAASLAPDAPLRAGERQCEHCEAKAVCPAYRGTLAVLQEQPVSLAELPAEKLEELKTAIQFADKIKGQVNSELRRRIDAGQMPGWKLRGSGDDREVIDPIGMYNHFMEQFDGMTPGDYDACREMIFGRLEDCVRRITNCGPKQAKERVDAEAEPFIKRTPKAKVAIREASARNQLA